MDDKLKENNRILKTELKSELKTEIILDFAQFVEENINPQFQTLEQRLSSKIDAGILSLENKISVVDNKIAQLRLELMMV